MNKLQEQINGWLDDNYPDQEILLADSFDEAFVGIATQFDKPIAVFDRQKCIKILMQDMSEEDAYEYFSFNVEGAYVGESTPAFIEFFSPDETNEAK